MSEEIAAPPRKPETVTELLALWPNMIRASGAFGLPAQTLYGWRRRNFIDLRHWDHVIAVLRISFGVELSKDDLHAMNIIREQRAA